VDQAGPELGFADAVFDVGAHAEPRLHVGGGVEPVAAGGHIGHDEAGGPPVGGGPLEDEGELVAVDGAPPPGAGVGADVGGVDPDPADDGVGPRGPPGGGVVADGDLRPGHPVRRRPLVLGDAGGGPPQGGVAFRGDGEVAPETEGGVGQLGGEVPGIGAHHRAVGVSERVPHLGGQGREGPAEQGAAVGAHILGAGEQVSGQG